MHIFIYYLINGIFKFRQRDIRINKTHQFFLESGRFRVLAATTNDATAATTTAAAGGRRYLGAGRHARSQTIGQTLRGWTLLPPGDQTNPHDDDDDDNDNVYIFHKDEELI